MATQIPVRLCLAACTCLALLAGSCQRPPAPVVQPFADGQFWVLKADMVWVIGETNLEIRVPRGFVMDFASVPKQLQSFVSPVDRHGRAAIVHDFLYWEQRCTREQADDLMRAAMVESGVDTATADKIYWAVRAGGGPAWAQNADERSKGLPRVIPDAAADIPAGADWSAYRETLFQQGVRPEPRDAGSAPYCEAAQYVLQDQTDVWATIADARIELGIWALGMLLMLSVLLLPALHFRYLHLILKTLREIQASRRQDRGDSAG